MAIETTYEKITDIIIENILNDAYEDGRLPNERLLSEEFKVSRSTIQKAIDSLVDMGLIIRKQRSGNYINQLFKKNFRDYEHQRKGPIGLTNSFSKDKDIASKVLKFEVCIPPKEVQETLLLNQNEFVYHILRIRNLDSVPVSIETAYIPIKLLPELTIDIVSSSIYQYAEQKLNLALSNSYLSIYSESSTSEDRKELGLSVEEPVTVFEEVIFTDTGIPFEYTIVRNHYKEFVYSTTSYAKNR